MGLTVRVEKRLRGLQNPWIGGIPEKVGDLIGSNNGLPTFAAVIRARHIAILTEYHEGGYLAEMFTVWGRISSLSPLRL